MWYSKGSITPVPPEPETVDISVSVSDGTGPVQGATVTLTDTTDSTKTFSSGASGSAGGCTISEVPLGTYTVSSTCTGYTDYTGAEALVVTAETTTLEIELVEEEVTPGG